MIAYRWGALYLVLTASWLVSPGFTQVIHPIMQDVESGMVPAKEPCFGVPLPDSAAPGQYAAGKAWYTSHAPLSLFGKRYVKFGNPHPPEILAKQDGGPVELVFAGTYDGVPFYAERGTTPTPRIIYMLLNSECHFLPYAPEEALR